MHAQASVCLYHWHINEGFTVWGDWNKWLVWIFFKYRHKAPEQRTHQYCVYKHSKDEVYLLFVSKSNKEKENDTWTKVPGLMEKVRERHSHLVSHWLFSKRSCMFQTSTKWKEDCLTVASLNFGVIVLADLVAYLVRFLLLSAWLVAAVISPLRMVCSVFFVSAFSSILANSSVFKGVIDVDSLEENALCMIGGFDILPLIWPHRSSE